MGMAHSHSRSPRPSERRDGASRQPANGPSPSAETPGVGAVRGLIRSGSAGPSGSLGTRPRLVDTGSPGASGERLPDSVLGLLRRQATPPDQRGTAPADQRGTAPADQRATTPADQRATTPAEQLNAAPADQLNTAPADQLNTAPAGQRGTPGSAPVIRRMLWVANDALQWVPQQPAEGQAAPATAPTAPGQVFDDESNTIHASMEDHVDAMDDDFLPEGEEEEDSGSGDEDEVMGGDDSDAPPDSADEMTLEERRQVELEALNRPAATSTRSARLDRPTTVVKTTDKLARKGGKKDQRDSDSGALEITLETVSLWVADKRVERQRPIKASGVVEPTVTTGRLGAPNPVAGKQIYLGAQGQLKESIPAERNTGMPDAERGHIVALELGGADIPENITPQWAKFQGSGEWRRMEMAVLAAAKSLPDGQRLRYEVEVFYKETPDITPTLNSFSVPTHFRATTQVLDEQGQPVGGPTVVFDQAQSQDITDNMLAERAMSRVDGPDWDASLNTQKKRPARSGSGKPRASRKKRLTDKPHVNLKRRRATSGKATDTGSANLTGRRGRTSSAGTSRKKKK